MYYLKWFQKRTNSILQFPLLFTVILMNQAIISDIFNIFPSESLRDLVYLTLTRELKNIKLYFQ